MNDKGEAIITRALSVTTHTARHSGITNMYLSHKFTIIQMMHVSDHKPKKTFLDYIKLSSDEIADEIAVMSKKDGEMWRINNSLPKSDLLAIFLKQAFVNNKYYDYFCSPKS
ncbi:MAG: hypothetical protein PUJ15_07690 [Bacteroidaceae bacterium]|nr:hypothetical protein [Bacteroidaceae bacterium]